MSAKTSGLSVARVHLALDDGGGVVEGVAVGAVDLRHAAEAVGVLDLAAVGVRSHDLAVGEEAAQVGGAGGLAGVRPHGLDARVEGAL